MIWGGAVNCPVKSLYIEAVMTLESLLLYEQRRLTLWSSTFSQQSALAYAVYFLRRTVIISVTSIEGSVTTAEIKCIYSAVLPESLNLIEVNFSVQNINQILVVLTVIGVYENVAVSCLHVSASEKVTRQELSSETTQTITTFSWSLVTLLTLRCVIPVVCVTNEREESVVKQHN